MLRALSQLKIQTLRIFQLYGLIIKEYSVNIVAELKLFGIKDGKNIIFYSPNDDEIIKEAEPVCYIDHKDKKTCCQNRFK
jgi:hypothetical protein